MKSDGFLKAIALAALLASVLTACGGGGGGSGAGGTCTWDRSTWNNCTFGK